MPPAQVQIAADAHLPAYTVALQHLARLHVRPGVILFGRHLSLL
jgi:hypothetical protein